MQFDWWKTQLLGDFVILDFRRVLDCLSVNPFGGQRRRGDRAATSERFEFCLDDFSVVVDLKNEKVCLSVRMSSL